MRTVEPIRDKKKLAAMKKVLKAQSLRDWLLFTLGINSGLRISDLLQLKVSNVYRQNRIRILEIKTGKEKDFPLSETCVKAVKEYLAETNLPVASTLFPSRKGGQVISRVQAYRIINVAARTVGITDPIGTHTMRKTFGYHAYQTGIDISRIQKLLNHSAPSVSLAYIGITKDELDSVYINLNL
ncbi:site-specific integrase [Clostridium estertheticum]|uniref:site-specific integrase n=1 Tax=Clostridium estertheticum TaxID=238834 RepID=UPI001651CB42|nr:site-specific integrase [Clostridium estertheticum]MBZ9609866.1 site-specific integrase [Clostridium estertheticum]